MIPCTTFAHFAHTPWITLMLSLQVYCHPMFYLLWIYRKCSNTLLTPYLQPCFYQYCTSGHPTLSIGTYVHNVLIENKQFLLLINIPIQDRACQITIHQVFILGYPTWKLTQPIMTSTQDTLESPRMPQWDWNLSTTQFEVFQQANGQFCLISTPFQPLANPPNMHHCPLHQERS